MPIIRLDNPQGFHTITESSEKLTGGKQHTSTHTKPSLD